MNMYPSNPSGIGIPSPFGIAPSSVHGVSNLVDDTCGPTFSWLTQSGVQSSSLLNEQPTAGGLKIGSADQMIDRSSFMSLDRHTPSLPRLTPHSIVAASSSSSSLAMASHGGGGGGGAGQQSDGAVVGGTFHPYRTASDGMPTVAGGVGHPSLSNSQFAAFDSIYNAYQNAYGSSSAVAAAGMFGNQQYSRYDNSLLAAEQQMLLQASLLQYPHLGIFPNAAALYPNLQSGLRYPGDYYCQNLASLSLLSKYPDMTGPSWLGIDRSSAVPGFASEREKDLKEYDPRKEQPDPCKRFEREALLSEHHKARHDRDDVRREPRADDVRKDHSSGSSSSVGRHHIDKEPLKNEQQKRSTSLRSPARHEHRHQDAGFSKFNAGHNEFTYTASRLQSGATCATTMEPLNLQKSLLSPSNTMHQQQQQQQRHAASRRDRNFELPQDYAVAKERHQMLHSKSDDMRDKRLMSMSGLPKPASSSAMNPVISPAQFKAQYEPKFHRPFEQVHQVPGSDASEATERQLGVATSHRDRHPGNAKAPSVYERKDYSPRTSSDGKSAMVHENHRLHHHHHQQQQQQHQLMAKANDRKMPLTSTASKRRSSELNDEMPLNLALTKVAHMDASANGEQERGLGRPRGLNLAAQESALTNAVGNSYVKRKSGTGVPGNSALRSTDKTRRDYVGPDANKASSLQQKPLVSKLDIMIARKAKAAAAAAGNSDDEMDEEKWENTCKEVAKCLLITSGPALADENSSQKIQFLGIFGLVTTDAFKELEFKQHQRRRRQMHESSLSPVQLDSAVESVCAGDPSIFNAKLDLAEASRSSTDKDSLLHLLQLRSVNTQVEQRGTQLNSHVEHLSAVPAKATALHQISKRHRHQVERSNSTTPPRCTNRVDGCDAERDRLQQQQLMMMGTEFLSHLRTSNTYDKLQQNDNSSSSSIHGRRPALLDPPPFAFDVNRCHQKNRAPLVPDLQTTAGPNCQDHCNHSATDGAGGGIGGGGGGALDVVTGHPCLSDASLHTKSATRCSSSLMISKEVVDGSSPLSSAVHHTAAASSSETDSAFNWPGHEAIIESYYHYIEERSMERQLLTEQNRRLHHLNNDLVLKSEQLRSHMTGLLQTKEQLTGNRCRLQSNIDDLKVCLKSLQ